MKTNTFRIKTCQKRSKKLVFDSTLAKGKTGDYHSFGRMLKKLDI